MKSLIIKHETGLDIGFQYYDRDSYSVSLRTNDVTHPIAYIKLQDGFKFSVSFPEWETNTEIIKLRDSFSLIETDTVTDTKNWFVYQLNLVERFRKGTDLSNIETLEIECPFNLSDKSDLEKCIADYLDFYTVSVHALEWAGLNTKKYEGFVQIRSTRLYLDDESAMKAATNSFKKGDVIKIQSEPTDTMIELYSQEYELEDWD